MFCSMPSLIHLASAFVPLFTFLPLLPVQGLEKACLYTSAYDYVRVSLAAYPKDAQLEVKTEQAMSSPVVNKAKW
jgi:hypothetical protein